MTHKQTNNYNRAPSPDTFIGRKFEQSRLLEAVNAQEAAIAIIYGRRRIGKTALIEHTLQNYNLVKLEGIEGGDKQAQMQRVLYQFGKALAIPETTHMTFAHWFELFDFLADKLAHGRWALYFEELQWLAEYKTEFIADLKVCWDNRFRHNPELLLVLCGSSPSFMINKVLHSKALYSRSQYELHLREFSLAEMQAILAKRSQREIMNAYLTVGGIPEYLKRLQQYTSIEVGIAELSFKQQSYFSQEAERIFISSFKDKAHYRRIIEILSQTKFATRKMLEKQLKITAGGNFTALLTDLELCGFIEKYQPYHLSNNSKLVRYCIADNYLQFYYKFIKPIAKNIDQGVYNENPMQALNKESYQKWLGFAFERFCRNNHRLIAKHIGFSAVRYRSGAYFSRATDTVDRGFQIDLIFERDDQVITVCEIKYLQSTVGTEVIHAFEQKLNVVRTLHNKTIETVLITAYGATDSLRNRAYFDHIIELKDLFDASR